MICDLYANSNIIVQAENFRIKYKIPNSSIILFSVQTSRQIDSQLIAKEQIYYNGTPLRNILLGKQYLSVISERSFNNYLFRGFKYFYYSQLDTQLALN